MKGRTGLFIHAGLLVVSLATSMVQAQEHVTRVSVLATGQLLLNDRPATLAAVEAEFKAVKSNNGLICYYREHAVRSRLRKRWLLSSLQESTVFL